VMATATYLLHNDGSLWRMSKRNLIKLKKLVVDGREYDLDDFGVMMAREVYRTAKLKFEEIKREE
jgi:hypothetical protein